MSPAGILSKQHSTRAIGRDIFCNWVIGMRQVANTLRESDVDMSVRRYGCGLPTECKVTRKRGEQMEKQGGEGGSLSSFPAARKRQPVAVRSAARSSVSVPFTAICIDGHAINVHIAACFGEAGPDSVHKNVS
jgi:hypothetical protein